MAVKENHLISRHIPPEIQWRKLIQFFE